MENKKTAVTNMCEEIERPEKDRKRTRVATEEGGGAKNPDQGPLLPSEVWGLIAGRVFSGALAVHGHLRRVSRLRLVNKIFWEAYWESSLAGKTVWTNCCERIYSPQRFVVAALIHTLAYGVYRPSPLSRYTLPARPIWNRYCRFVRILNLICRPDDIDIVLVPLMTRLENLTLDCDSDPTALPLRVDGAPPAWIEMPASITSLTINYSKASLRELSPSTVYRSCRALDATSSSIRDLKLLGLHVDGERGNAALSFPWTRLAHLEVLRLGDCDPNLYTAIPFHSFRNLRKLFIGGVIADSAESYKLFDAVSKALALKRLWLSLQTIDSSHSIVVPTSKLPSALTALHIMVSTPCSLFFFFFLRSRRVNSASREITSLSSSIRIPRPRLCSIACS